MTRTPAADRSLGMIYLLFMAGVGFAIGGVAMTIHSHVSTTAGPFEPEATGSSGLYDLGLVLSGIGGVLLGIATIAMGVVIGMRVTRGETDQAPGQEPAQTGHEGRTVGSI